MSCNSLLQLRPDLPRRRVRSEAWTSRSGSAVVWGRDGQSLRRARARARRAARIRAHLERSSVRTGRGRFARPTSSLTMRPRRRTSRRSPSSPRCGHSRFDRRRPFGPWLPRIVVNRSIDWARAHSGEPGRAHPPPPAPKPSRPPRDDVLAALGAPRAGAPRRGRDALPAEFTPGEIARRSVIPRAEPSTRACGGGSTRSPAGGAARHELERVEIPGESEGARAGLELVLERGVRGPGADSAALPLAARRGGRDRAGRHRRVRPRARRARP